MRSSAILILATALVSSAMTWFIADARFSARLAEVQESHATEQKEAAELHAAALDKALKETARFKKEKDDAVERAAQRAASQAADLAAARAESDRLRKHLSNAKARLSSAPVSAVVEYADTVAELYAECEAELTETAAKADGHASDVQLIVEAWPRESD